MWPRSLWKAADKLAKSRGLTMDQYVAGLLADDIAPFSTVLTPNNLARAKEIAGILEMTPAEYINDVLGTYLDDIHGGGRVMDIEVMDRLCFETKREAHRIGRKASAFDEGKSGYTEAYPPLRQDSDGAWCFTFREVAA